MTNDLDGIGGRRITSIRDLVKTHGGPVQDAAIRDLERCEVCWADRGAPCRTSNLETRIPHPGRKSAKDQPSEKSTHGHRWQEVADAPGARSYETCSLKGCKARRPVPDCRQAGAPSDVEKTCRCPDCVKAR